MADQTSSSRSAGNAYSGVKAAETRGIKRAEKMGKRAGWDSRRGSIRRHAPYMAKGLESMVLYAEYLFRVSSALHQSCGHSGVLSSFLLTQSVIMMSEGNVDDT